MSDVDPFQKYAERYDRWFLDHSQAYASERKALKSLLPPFERGLEAGVGTGRFAEPLHIRYGIDPAEHMLRFAADRNIHVVRAEAEHMPFARDAFDLVLFVTTICFVNNLRRSLLETRRVLRTNGAILIGFIDRESPPGQTYVKHKRDRLFYREATFYSFDELQRILTDTGFGAMEAAQTMFQKPGEMKEPDPVRPGTGDGLFVAVRANPAG